MADQTTVSEKTLSAPGEATDPLALRGYNQPKGFTASADGAFTGTLEVQARRRPKEGSAGAPGPWETLDGGAFTAPFTINGTLNGEFDLQIVATDLTAGTPVARLTR